jgi:hypothetical protein
VLLGDVSSTDRKGVSLGHAGLGARLRLEDDVPERRVLGERRDAPDHALRGPAEHRHVHGDGIGVESRLEAGEANVGRKRLLQAREERQPGEAVAPARSPGVPTPRRRAGRVGSPPRRDATPPKRGKATLPRSSSAAIDRRVPSTWREKPRKSCRFAAKKRSASRPMTAIEISTGRSSRNGRLAKFQPKLMR